MLMMIIFVMFIICHNYGIFIVNYYWYIFYSDVNAVSLHTWLCVHEQKNVPNDLTRGAFHLRQIQNGCSHRSVTVDSLTIELKYVILI